MTLAISTEETVAQDTVKVNVSAKNDVHTPEDHILKKQESKKLTIQHIFLCEKKNQ